MDQKAEVIDQFTQQAESYAALTTRMRGSGPFDRIAFITPSPEDRVLDIATGTGSLALALAPHVAAVTGLDLTPAMIDQARAAAARDGLSNIDWTVGDAAPLPFADGAFTLVTCGAAFHHLTDPAAALAEMRRVCAPGGRVMVTDLTPDPAISAAFDRFEVLRDPSHTHALTLDELRAAARRAGLTEADCRSYATTLPIEMVFATSFPAEGVLDMLRARLRKDADDATDTQGFGARWQDGEIWVTYPMSAVLWRR